MSKKICVIGLGYIGLPTAALLANNGYEVVGIDINSKVINTINKGKIHIVEPDLENYVNQCVSSKRLRASLQPEFADIFIIAVPTPFKENFEPDLSYIESATLSIAPYVKEENIVILESTSPVGTTKKVQLILENAGVDISKIHIAYCPERVLPGNIMKELVENDRIVGGITPESTEKVKKFYETFVKGKVLDTGAETAEMCKLVENSYRDVNIAFANELSIISDQANINVWELIRLANHHPRVNILQPGSGVGGHCIAVDPWFIVSQFPTLAKIIKTAREVNDYKKEWVIEKIINSSLNFEITHKRKPKVVCMGLAFKPDIDDLRESPALSIAKALINKKIDVISVEPNIPLEEENNLNLSALEDAIQVGDIFCFLVKHSLFKNLELREDAIILDFCGIKSDIN